MREQKKKKKTATTSPISTAASATSEPERMSRTDYHLWPAPKLAIALRGTVEGFGSEHSKAEGVRIDDVRLQNPPLALLALLNVEEKKWDYPQILVAARQVDSAWRQHWKQRTGDRQTFKGNPAKGVIFLRHFPPILRAIEALNAAQQWKAP